MQSQWTGNGLVVGRVRGRGDMGACASSTLKSFENVSRLFMSSAHWRWLIGVRRKALAVRCETFGTWPWRMECDRSKPRLLLVPVLDAAWT